MKSLATNNKNKDVIVIRDLKQQEYLACFANMRDFTINRTEETLDEIWLVEHDPVLTQGQNGKPEHILKPDIIPIVQTDRGGQVTYHGPGQLMVYTLIDLKRKQFNVREFVSALEQSVIDLLASYQVEALADPKAPGVYVSGKKICSIGLRVKRGCTYHGIALNVNMNLTPFTYIHPCGFAKLTMTQLALVTPLRGLSETGAKLVRFLMKNLRYNESIGINTDGK